ncbi:MAG: right-handed parallel beta-helix repeat-containing protein [Planctomycetia bacterium]|nr:right-handed parallel beta-helix repeat-containing protein [Planctomycetia bacterium]
MNTAVRSLISLLVVATASAVAAATELYVSPTGRDADPGTREKPLATLSGARDAVRRLKQAGPLREVVTVHVATGTYVQIQPLEFTQQDSGTATTPIIYLAELGSTVRLTGGREVGSWQAVADADILKRLPEEARGHVVAADLRAQGITDFGTLAVRGFGAGSQLAEAELFFDDEPMTLARWPNAGFRGAKSKDGDLIVIADTDRVSRWSAEIEPWIFAYWHHDWAELYEPLAGVDAARQALLRTPKVKPVYGITPDRVRWYAYNLLSELDSPGEYYLDRLSGRLYFWPLRQDGRAVLSAASDLIRADNLSHVVFRGFTLEACRGTAVTLGGGSGCRIESCVIRNTGHRAVQVAEGSEHEVYGCDVYHTGEGGISMSGGLRPTLTPANHNAENNHVHHYSRRARTYKSAVSVSGVGSRIAHNLIHDGPHMALSAGGNDHVLDYNEIHNVVEDSGDAGAYYVGRDWTQRGNVLRHNYWHDIVGSTGYGGMTIYLDDQHCGHAIHGNLFERCMQSVFIGGGDDNLVTNNVFLDCWKSAHLDNRGVGWQKKATDDPRDTLRTQLRSMPYTNALWRSRYPTLVNILDDDPGVPKRNVFASNISAGGKWEDIASSIRSLQTVAKNLVFDDDKDWARLTKDAAGKPVRLEFKNANAVRAIGFAPLQLAKMGLYEDERRASWPVPRAARSVQLPQDKGRE